MTLPLGLDLALAHLGDQKVKRSRFSEEQIISIR